MSDFKPVLVVVDMQNGFVSGGSAHVVPIVADLVRRWEETGNPIIITRYHNYPGSPFERLVKWYNLQQSPEIDLVDELAPYVGHPQVHVLDKDTYTAFTEEGRRLISEHGFTDLFICGIATDGCVLKTTLDAFDSGYTPWVVKDACASNASKMPPKAVHSAALMLLSRLVGTDQIIDADKALGMLPINAGDLI